MKRIILIAVAILMTVTLASAEGTEGFGGFSMPDWANGGFDTSSWGNFGDMSWDNFNMPDWDTSSWGNFDFSMPEQGGTSWGNMGDFATSFDDMQKQNEEKFNSFTQQYGFGTEPGQQDGQGGSMADLQSAFENSQNSGASFGGTGNIKTMFTNIFGGKATSKPTAIDVEKPAAPTYHGVGSSGGQVAALSQSIISSTNVEKQSLGDLPIGETAAQHQFSMPSALSTFNSTPLTLSAGMQTDGSEFKSLYSSGKSGMGSGGSGTGTKSIYGSK